METVQALSSKPFCLSFPSAGNTGVQHHTRTFTNARFILFVIKSVRTLIERVFLQPCEFFWFHSTRSQGPSQKRIPSLWQARLFFLCCASKEHLLAIGFGESLAW